MSAPSFLNRKSFGLSNYLLIAMIVAGGAAMIPLAARKAVQSNTNRAEDWLPASFSESEDLAWFRSYFASGSVLVCTWDDCTLGNDQQLRLLSKKLSQRLAPADRVAASLASPHGEQAAATGRWFRLIAGGPSVIDQLTSEPLNLTYPAAVERLEGSLVGPRATGPDGQQLGDESRPTCLAIYLAPEGYANNVNMRLACEEIERVAVEECGIDRDSFRLAGAPADNVAIDATSKTSFRLVSILSGLVGMLLAYWCYRSIGLTGIVVAAAWLCSGAALAIVYYYGAGEVLLGGFDSPHFGTLDAVTMTMPAVVYVLGISAAVHLVNYYLDARHTLGIAGAAEQAVRMGWKPCALAALTTAIGLGSLAASDIVPIKKFGAFSAVAVLVSVAIMFSILPVFLHRFPPQMRRSGGGSTGGKSRPRWLLAAAEWVTGHHAWVTTVGLVVMLITGLGLMRLESSVQVLKLLDPQSDLIADYAWIEENLANVVPMEVVVTIPEEICRGGQEHAESTGLHYRMTMLERLNLVRRLSARIEELPAVSRTMSVATLGPEPQSRRADYTVNESLEDHRDRLQEYLKVETTTCDDGTSEPDRELWRITARVSALDDVDYGEFVAELEQEVEPLLEVYRSRDVIVRRLAEAGKQLDGARITVLFRGPTEAERPEPGSHADLVARLLWESGVRSRVNGRQGGIQFFNLANVDAAREEKSRTELLAELQEQDALLILSAADDVAVRHLQLEDLPLINLAALGPDNAQASVAASLEAGPRAVRAVYTGVVPLVFKTQRQLLVSLRESMFLAALTIGLVMTVLLRNPIAGAISMVPNAFPLVVVFGLLSWLGVKVDVGIMMSAGVALGVAVDDTIHFLTWFRRGTTEGLGRRDATRLAYQRCAAAMTQTTLIAGLGMALFILSPFMPTQRFGLMMVVTLTAALVGDLVLLPAILTGPLGWFFAGRQQASAASAPSHPQPVIAGSSLDKQATTAEEPTPEWLPLVLEASPGTDQAELAEIADSPPEDLRWQSIVAQPVGVDEQSENPVGSPWVTRHDAPEPANSSHDELRARLRSFRRDDSPQG